MGARGPQKGFKLKAKQGGAATPLSSADRENPNKLTGEALQNFAHARGLSRSELVGMADEKIRTQLLYITNRQYSEEVA